MAERYVEPGGDVQSVIFSSGTMRSFSDQQQQQHAYVPDMYVTLLSVRMTFIAAYLAFKP